MADPYWLSPGAYRYGLKKGMTGTDVAALQINLDHDAIGSIDGDYGKKTETAIKVWQKDHNLLDDGICGPRTFQSLCVELATPAARKYKLPVGMAKSIMFAESNFIIGANGPHPSDAGEDVGPFEISSGPQKGSQDFYYFAFNIAESAEYVCQRLKQYRDTVPEPVDSSYLQAIGGGDKDLFKWQLTVLNHNWPYAAYNIPRRGHIFVNSAQDDQTAQWIVSASGGTMSTPRQWVTNYIKKTTIFVKF